MAGAVGMQPISPTPLAPKGPDGIAALDADHLDFGDVLGLGQSQFGHAVRGQAAVLEREQFSLKAYPMPMTTPPSIWPSNSAGLMIVPAVVGRVNGCKFSVVVQDDQVSGIAVGKVADDFTDRVMGWWSSPPR